MLKNLDRTSMIALTLALLASTPALAQGSDPEGGRHVLLISIDGMHALDYKNCVNANTCPN
jgi:hypothetical protein